MGADNFCDDRKPSLILNLNLLACTSCQQCFATATIQLFGNFEKFDIVLPCGIYSLLIADLLKILTKQRELGVVEITKKICV